MKFHIQTQHGEKPYTCQQCDNTFNESGTMKVHIQTQHGETPYSTCQQCDNGFNES